MADPRRNASSGRSVGPTDSASAPKGSIRPDEGSLSKATGSAAFGSAPRGPRTTTVARTPVVPKEHHPHRSQTTPATSADYARRAAATTQPIPPPKIEKKSVLDASHAGFQQTQVPDGRKLLAGTDYRIEPLSGEQNDSLWLSPPAPSMPGGDYRQSGSSFQTEPSSYYSADDNAPSGGPPPPMPDHRTFEQRYESLWQAAQAPSMPVPDTSLPSPYERSSEYTQNLEGDAHAPKGGPHIDEGPVSQHDRRDPYDSSWLAAPSPGMPIPSTTSPSMPVPNARATVEGMPETNNRPSYRIEDDEANIGDDIPPTAPLRIHHHHHHTHRPPEPSKTTITAAAATSNASRPSAQSTIPHDYSGTVRPHRTQTGQTTANLSSQPGSPPSRPIPTSSQRVEFDQPSSKLQHPANVPQKPTTSTPVAVTSRPQPILQTSSRFDSNGPIQPKPTVTTAASSASAAEKPTSIYAQYTSNRPSAQAQGNGAARPPAQVAPSAASRPEQRPTAPTHTTSSSAPPKPPPVQQSSSYHNEANQSSRPPGAAPSAFSTSVNQRPSQAQSQQQASHNGRPHVTETSRPQTVSTPPQPQPQPQPKPATASSRMEERRQAAAKANAAMQSMPTRPHMHGEPSQMDTQYVNMMLALDDIPMLHNILVGFFNWILLAGFILFPGTFTSLENLPSDQVGAVGQKVIHSVTGLPLYIVAWVCCGVGAGGMIWLWWRWRKNYLWGLNKIFVPGLMNSLAGLLSTIANIFGAQHGELSTTSKSTLIVTGASTGVFLIFSGFYTFWLVRRVKERHDRTVGKELAGKYGEGVVDVSTRKL